jgi:hypothetical protein
VWLEAESDGSVVTARIRFEPGEGASGPRVAEHYLRLSDNLVWEDAVAGPAAEAAEKQVIARPVDGGVRVVLLSADNLHTLESGVLYELHLHRTSTEPASIGFDQSRGPLFAPDAASQGLRVGESLLF